MVILTNEADWGEEGEMINSKSHSLSVVLEDSAFIDKKLSWVTLLAASSFLMSENYDY